MLALAFVLCGAVALATETGSDGAPLNGMAPLYVHVAPGKQRALSATLTLPAVASNKAWYANWIMLVGTSGAVPHQMFVQVGLIRRPDEDKYQHLFLAWQEIGNRIVFRQLGVLAGRVHRFSIAQNGNAFSLLADGRTVAQLALPRLAHAQRTYAEIGPEVYAEGDALSGVVRYAAVQSGAAWLPVNGPGACHYQNHGTVLKYSNGEWRARGQFDRHQPSTFHGSCSGI